MQIIHTLLFMIREQYLEEDLIMAGKCFESLSNSKENTVVIYNQGCLKNDQLHQYLSHFNINYHILGNGTNIGIPLARQSCFEYIWATYGGIPYISEIHVDMIFPKEWYSPLIEYLECNDEPMISPAIITQSGEIFPRGNGKLQIPDRMDEILELLGSLSEDKIIKGFVHPVIHKANQIKNIGGYDVSYFPGKQGYEDDSLLLGYLYYMGIRSGWHPKVNFNAFVYHAYMGQRTTLDNMQEDFKKNLQGLYKQYGANGLKHLTELHIDESVSHFKRLLDNIMKT